MLDVDWWETKNTRTIRKCFEWPGVKEYMLGTPNYDWESIYNEVNSYVDCENVKIYEVRHVFDVVGMIFFEIKDNYAKIDYTYKKCIRGKLALKISKCILSEFSNKYGIKDFRGRIKIKNKASLCAAKWMGFKKISTADGYYEVKRVLSDG